MKKTLTFPQIAAAFITANNPSAVKKAIVDAGIITDESKVDSLSEKELARIVYGVYLKNGAKNYAIFLKNIPLNRSANNWTTDVNKLKAMLNDMNGLFPSYNEQQAMAGVPTTLSFGDVFNDVWDKIVGGTTIEKQPIVTQTTSASPMTIGLIIGGVAVLGIIAWVVIKS